MAKAKEMPVIIDTSVWVDYFHGKDKELIEVVKDLIIVRRARLCGVILCELMAGVRTEADQNLLAEVIEVVDYLEVSRPIWELAGKTSARLRSHGIKVPISDLVIGALAIEHNCQLLTADSHFDYIPELKRFP